MLTPVPRRDTPIGYVELRVRVDGERVVLEPGGFSQRFFAGQAVLLVVFAGIGAGLAYFVRNAGTFVMVWMLVMAAMGWGPLALLSAAAAVNAQAGGVLCIVDRRAGTFEAPREGVRLDGVVEEVCFVRFEMVSRSSRGFGVGFRSQLLVAARDRSGERHIIPLALACGPASAGRRFAEACGAVFTTGWGPSQDQGAWVDARDWTFRRSGRTPKGTETFTAGPGRGGG